MLLDEKKVVNVMDLLVQAEQAFMPKNNNSQSRFQSPEPALTHISNAQKNQEMAKISVTSLTNNHNRNPTTSDDLPPACSSSPTVRTETALTSKRDMTPRIDVETHSSPQGASPSSKSCKIQTSPSSELCSIKTSSTNVPCTLKTSSTSKPCTLHTSSTSKPCTLHTSSTSKPCTLQTSSYYEPCTLQTSSTSKPCTLQTSSYNEPCTLQTGSACQPSTLKTSPSGELSASQPIPPDQLYTIRAKPDETIHPEFSRLGLADNSISLLGNPRF